MDSDPTSLLDVHSGVIPFESLITDPPAGCDRAAWTAAAIDWLARHGVHGTPVTHPCEAIVIGDQMLAIGYHARITITGPGLFTIDTAPADEAPAGRGWTIDGFTHWLRTTGDYDCICCDGKHVFSRSIVTTGTDSYQQVIDQAIRELPEGARVRVSVTVLAEAT